MKDNPPGNNLNKEVVIIGGGPAGLTAGYELCRKNVHCVILEKDNEIGGLSKTVKYQGFRFDLGAHRYFTKSRAINQLWQEFLGQDFINVERLTRVLTNGKFFYYPLRISNVIRGLGLKASLLVLFSYLKARINPIKPEKNLSDWVTNRFGKRLFEIFFKTYTEKVWGLSCSKISPEWAAQRIKDLSLTKVVNNAIFGQDKKRQGPKSLINSFFYPRNGSGMMWESFAEYLCAHGGSIQRGHNCQKIVLKEQRVVSVISNSMEGERGFPGTHFISSMPLRELILSLDPPGPQAVVEAAKKLNYRSLLIVFLIVDQNDLFQDNWIYVHDPKVKVGRIDNFKNFSAAMVPDKEKTGLAMEYFCSKDDEFWTMSDDDIVQFAGQELERLDLCARKDIAGAEVCRIPCAYPIYDHDYKVGMGVIKGFLNQISNLQVIGRGGMHRYNNMDHSMMTAMKAVENVFGAQCDLWDVNVDQEYLEERSE